MYAHFMAKEIDFTIANTYGEQGRAWDATYPTLEAAVDAVRVALGWESIEISMGFADGDDDISWTVYETELERNADDDGARAPRITCRRTEFFRRAASERA